jgi:hypothetical protein
MKKQQETTPLFLPDVEAELQRLSEQRHHQLIEPAAHRLQAYKIHFMMQCTEIAASEVKPRPRPIPIVFLFGGIAFLGHSLSQKDWDGAFMGTVTTLAGYGLIRSGRNYGSSEVNAGLQRIEAVENYIQNFNENNGLQGQV